MTSAAFDAQQIVAPACRASRWVVEGGGVEVLYEAYDAQHTADPNGGEQKQVGPGK